MENKTTEDEIIITCDCGAHKVVVRTDADVSADGPSNQCIEMAFFSYGNYFPKPSIWRRIVLACKLLFKGTLFVDSIVMAPDEATKLSDFLKYKVENPTKKYEQGK